MPEHAPEPAPAAPPALTGLPIHVGLVARPTLPRLLRYLLLACPVVVCIRRGPEPFRRHASWYINIAVYVAMVLLSVKEVSWSMRPGPAAGFAEFGVAIATILLAPHMFLAVYEPVPEPPD